MKRPDFDSIKTYDEFKKYRWNRNELIEICKAHGLLFVGTEKKLNKVIESYFNGVRIPPRRTWYTNAVLSSFVNENGLSMFLDLGITAVLLIFLAIGIINYIRCPDDAYYVLFIAFSVPVLIFEIIGFQVDRDLEVIRSYGPVCGDKRFSREQVDEQANSEKTERLRYENILLAPDMLIGVSAGVAAIAYEDISSLQVKQTWHNERIGPRGSRRYRVYYTYKIIVRTNKGKKVAISDSREDAETAVKTVYEHCLKHNPQVELLEMKKSSMAPDDSIKQVTEGSGVKHSVDRAVQEQYLIRITPDEELKKRFIRFHRRSALILIPESLIVSAIAAVILFFSVSHLHRLLWVFPLFVALLFPFYAVYDLFKTLRSIRNDDIEFYSGEIVDKNKNGFFIRGVDCYRFGYIKKMEPENEPGNGDRVILARFRDGYSLISDKI